MMGSLTPRVDWRIVTMPETKNIVEMMYPRAGSLALKKDFDDVMP